MERNPESVKEKKKGRVVYMLSTKLHIHLYLGATKLIDESHEERKDNINVVLVMKKEGQYKCSLKKRVFVL